MHFKLLPLILLASSLTASAQNTPVLRAHSVYYMHHLSGLVPEDSVVHIHLNGRNSIATPSRDAFYYPNNGIYADDTAYRYWPQSSVSPSRFYRKFNTAGLTTELVEETLIPTPAVVHKTVFSYNSAMMPDTVLHYMGQSPTGRDFYIYQSGKPVSFTQQFYHTGTSSWRNMELDSFATAGGAGSDSVFISYTWVNNNAWFELERHNYVRDINNRVLIDSVSDSSAFSHVFYKQYDGQGRLVADSVMRWDAPTSVMVIASKLTYHYDAQGNMTSRNINSLDLTSNWYLVALDSFAYNNHHQVAYSATYDKLQTGLTLRPGTNVQRFYYHDPVSVPEVARNKSLQLYPIPATSYINLKMSFTKPQPFSVRIFDMQGRLVNNWQEPPQKDYNKLIPLTNMAPGQYTVHIFAGSESVSKQFMVVR